MELKPDKYKEFIKYVMRNFKELETELMAYRAVFASTKFIVDSDVADAMGESLRQALVSPDLLEQMRQKYDVKLEEFLKQVDQSIPDRAFLWLREWKPGGPIN